MENVDSVGLQSYTRGITVAPAANTGTHSNQHSLLNSQQSALAVQQSEEVVTKVTVSGTGLYELETLPSDVAMTTDSSITMDTDGPITVVSGTELGKELIADSLPTQTGSSVVQIDRKPDVLSAATSVPVDLAPGAQNSVETIIIQQTTESGEIQEIALPIQQAQTLLSGAGITGLPGLSCSVPSSASSSTSQANIVSSGSDQEAPITTTAGETGYTEIMIPANQVAEYMQQMTGQNVTFVTQ